MSLLTIVLSYSMYTERTAICLMSAKLQVEPHATWDSRVKIPEAGSLTHSQNLPRRILPPPLAPPPDLPQQWAPQTRWAKVSQKHLARRMGRGAWASSSDSPEEMAAEVFVSVALKRWRRPFLSPIWPLQHETRLKNCLNRKLLGPT